MPSKSITIFANLPKLPVGHIKCPAAKSTPDQLSHLYYCPLLTAKNYMSVTIVKSTLQICFKTNSSAEGVP